MELEKTATSYCIEIESDSFDSLLEYENAWHGGLKSSEPGLEEILRNMGCSDVEYDGHYLNYIYFTVDIDDDNKKFHKEIIEAIKKHLQKAKDWKKNNV